MWTPKMMIGQAILKYKCKLTFTPKSIDNFFLICKRWGGWRNGWRSFDYSGNGQIWEGTVPSQWNPFPCLPSNEFRNTFSMELLWASSLLKKPTHMIKDVIQHMQVLWNLKVTSLHSICGYSPAPYRLAALISGPKSKPSSFAASLFHLLFSSFQR